MNLARLFGSLGLKSIENAFVFKEKIGRSDVGILKVAMMVAALDGEISDSEYAAFESMAKKCRGATEDTVSEALDEAIRSAGYLMLKAKRSSDEELVKAFVSEAESALPDGFAYCASLEEVRRAIALWVAMGMSDGDYSSRERMCVEALRRHFAELKISHIEAEEERYKMLSPAFRAAYGNKSDVTLISRDFTARVEKLFEALGDSLEAERALAEIVSKG